MIGKIIGAAVGGSIAKNTKGIGGTTGAMLGAAVPMVLSRMSIPAMLAIGAGGWALKKYMGKDELPEPRDKKTAPVASPPQPKKGDPATA
ncbi:hypothetical protein [Qipengyuania nanhaisediminis]|uniref:hypothetical protein n=1 Tax=Qipengyuania nanhaisediminis TaxID=604088 RepID=UPI0038B26ACF